MPDCSRQEIHEVTLTPVKEKTRLQTYRNSIIRYSMEMDTEDWSDVCPRRVSVGCNDNIGCQNSAKIAVIIMTYIHDIHLMFST